MAISELKVNIKSATIRPDGNKMFGDRRASRTNNILHVNINFCDANDKITSERPLQSNWTVFLELSQQKKLEELFQP